MRLSINFFNIILKKLVPSLILELISLRLKTKCQPSPLNISSIPNKRINQFSKKKKKKIKKKKGKEKKQDPAQLIELIYYITIFKENLNLEGHQNRITAILLNGLIFPIGQSSEASQWRVCYQQRQLLFFLLFLAICSLGLKYASIPGFYHDITGLNLKFHTFRSKLFDVHLVPP